MPLTCQHGAVLFAQPPDVTRSLPGYLRVIIAYDKEEEPFSSHRLEPEGSSVPFQGCPRRGVAEAPRVGTCGSLHSERECLCLRKGP